MAVPRSSADGAKKNRHGADLNRSVAEQKHAASRINPGRDASAENAAKVQREGWSRTTER